MIGEKKKLVKGKKIIFILVISETVFKKNL